eukprot:scaffold115662_cov20-Tisochrysis_lutea.AAC.2
MVDMESKLDDSEDYVGCVRGDLNGMKHSLLISAMAIGCSHMHKCMPEVGFRRVGEIDNTDGARLFRGSGFGTKERGYLGPHLAVKSILLLAELNFTRHSMMRQLTST